MGKVYLVGAGPGDPDLITVKGLKCIKEADIILYDRLVNKELLKYAKENVEFQYCGKSPQAHFLQQETINHYLVKHAKKGRVVTRLKGGDPFVFGRGGEEAEFLAKNGVDFEVVPGITAGIAAPAYAGIPVTHRDFGSSFAFITGHQKNGEQDNIKWESLAKGIDTLAIYMGVGSLSYIQEKLLFYGKDPETPVALIHWGTLSEQRTVVGTLRTIVNVVKKDNITNPSMIIVGEVVHLRQKMNWFEKLQVERSTLTNEAF